jgi:hypothetical protein
LEEKNNERLMMIECGRLFLKLLSLTEQLIMSKIKLNFT